jgi:DNA-binding MarR family transcriptional regulator
MAPPDDWYTGWPTGVLLGRARQSYRTAVRAALAEAGFDDLPRNGPYLIGGIVRTGKPLREIITQLRVSKQTAGQLVDTLVLRGYLERTVDSEDRRRITLTLNERGHAAAAVVRSAVDLVDARLVERVGREQFALTLATLAALIDLASEAPDRNDA